MTLPTHLNLETAELAYVVANTPLYLIRRLQADAGVKLLSQTMSASEIAAEFREAVTREPRSLRDRVIPYVCLVALSIKDDFSALKEQTAVNPLPNYKWINKIRQILIETYRPISRMTVRGTGMISASVSDRSTASVNRIEIPVSSDVTS